MGSLALGASKRGLAYNENIPLKEFGGNGTYISWQYNWGSSTAHKQDNGREYVPMLWSNYTTANFTWTADAQAWIANGSTHLLAFNEPEQSAQANLSPAVAASFYRVYLEPFAGQAKLGAPAVSNDGWDWLNQFLGNCSDCTIDFIPVHWYNPWNLTSDLEMWVNKTCGLPAGRPVWVTEFGPTDAASLTTDQQNTFLEQATNFLDTTPCVERYAYFGSADGDESLLANGGPCLSTLGKQYTYGSGSGSSSGSGDENGVGKGTGGQSQTNVTISGGTSDGVGNGMFTDVVASIDGATATTASTCITTAVAVSTRPACKKRRGRDRACTHARAYQHVHYHMHQHDLQEEHQHQHRHNLEHQHHK
ncbi:glycosyl hydrolase catalytic core-domain-containing protein [Coniella lustricola]|uniref:Glycosyl hydrolase catalytic core-domain-containing protein n=1 Tax=Coniella lustricola TaxID=2025994 RepID=A0A2T3AD25_9PEZI|nr:glycosyl hydrolase catalytic core-domain-containing protein [Coniella lustricola]